MVCDTCGKDISVMRCGGHFRDGVAFYHCPACCTNEVLCSDLPDDDDTGQLAQASDRQLVTPSGRQPYYDIFTKDAVEVNGYPIPN